VRDLVTALERAVIDLAAAHHTAAVCRERAPGVYVNERKLASVGLRIRRGGSYHGLALNVNMDLAPFRRINPCGYAGLEMTQLAALGGPGDVRQTARALVPLLLGRLGRGSDAQPGELGEA
jgi:lipoyl(octanoyl) transferase